MPETRDSILLKARLIDLFSVMGGIESVRTTSIVTDSPTMRLLRVTQLHLKHTRTEAWGPLVEEVADLVEGLESLTPSGREVAERLLSDGWEGTYEDLLLASELL